MKKYMTPDFDVTVYEIVDTITVDGDDMPSIDVNGDGTPDWNGDVNFG